MCKILEFVEPWSKYGGHCTIEIKESDAIKYQKAAAKQMNKKYKNDKQALDDFIIIHWAWYQGENK